MQPATKFALAQRYATFSDGELLAIALERETLTVEAQLALSQELAKRKLTEDSIQEYAAEQDESEVEVPLPREVEYPSSANVPEDDSDTVFYREQLLQASRQRTLPVFVHAAAVLVLLILKIVHTYIESEKFLAAVAIAVLTIDFIFSWKAYLFQCPRCETTVKLNKRYVRCPKCRLRILPTDDLEP